MQATALVLFSLLAVVISGVLARVTRLPLPLVQMGLGAAVAQSGLPAVVLDPQLFFLLFLPPLLFLDGWRLPRQALQRDAGAILRLALGLVLFTVLGMGFFIHWLIPAMPLAVAFALAAVIAPTDPIAVSAIAHRTPLPDRTMQVLEGEALLNDASGLVCMRFAVAAALTGSFSLAAALGEFLWLAGVGLAVGVACTWAVVRAVAWGTPRFGEDGGAQILVTLLIPFGVYLLAEHLGGSGILAAVAAGVTMSRSDLWPWQAETRLRRGAVWDMVQLAANGSIFVLLGQQLPALLDSAPATVRSIGHDSAGWLLIYVVVIVAALASMRFAWVWVALKLGTRREAGGAPPRPSPDLRQVGVMALAGVRGAVTLAGVLTLPLLGRDGEPFPARDLAIVLAAGVIVLSLALASAALPALLRRWVQPQEPDPGAAEQRARRTAAEAAVLAIERHAAAMARQPARRAGVADASARVLASYREQLEAPPPGARAAVDASIERELRYVALRAERAAMLRAGPAEGLDAQSLRRVLREFDLLEARRSN